MKQNHPIRKAVAAALAILTMLTVSFPAGAAVRFKVITPDSCPTPDWTRQLCKDGQCAPYYRIICGGIGCAQNQPPAQQPTAKHSLPAAQPTEPSTQAQSVPAQSNSQSSLSAYEREVVTLTNKYRAQYSLAPLSIDAHLSDIARMKSQDMRDKGYFDHNSPTYGSPFEMMKRFGVTYRTAGENIAMGYRTAQSVVDGWMNSPGHRANILNKSFTKIGVGYAADGNYCTQMFIG